MSSTIELSPETFSRLQNYAKAFIDTPETVIKKLADFFDTHSGTAPVPFAEPATDTLGVRTFSPVAPPSLTHTKVLSIKFNGKLMERAEANWNGLLQTAVREAKRRAKSAAEFKHLVVVNFVTGEKTDEGYRPIPDTGISVQGQDANSSWRAACHIAQELGCNLEVKFAWRDKEAAAFPGVTGQFVVQGH